jgi:hypothetical protein
MSDSEDDLTIRSNNAIDYDSDGEEMIKHEFKQKVKHKHIIIPDGHFFGVIFGSTGSGKTSVLRRLIPKLTDKINVVYILQGKDDDIHESVKNWCIMKGKKCIIIGDIIDAYKELEKHLNEKKEDDHTLLIFDDFGNCKTSQDDIYNNLVIFCHNKIRSLNCHIISIVQDYLNIPPKQRNNLNFWCFLELPRKKGITQFKNDISTAINEKHIENIFNKFNEIVTKETHCWLTFKRKPSLQVYKKFNEKIFDSNELPVSKKGCALTSRRELFETAKELGLNKKYYKSISTDQIKEYINQISAQQQKNAGNTAVELDQILTKVKKPNINIRNQFFYHLNKYEESRKPRNLKKLIQLAEELVNNDIMDEDDIIYHLQNVGLENIKIT